MPSEMDLARDWIIGLLTIAAGTMSLAVAVMKFGTASQVERALLLVLIVAAVSAMVFGSSLLLGMTE